MAQLTPETFLAVAEMIHGHLRTRAEDRWSPHICRLKFLSFTTEFPEVNDAQFMWSAERWIQQLEAGFTRFPTWRELMAPLYRTQGGLANRSWGFALDLPEFLQPSQEQLALLPAQATSIAAAADPSNAAAYQRFVADHRPTLPPARQEGEGLTEEVWQTYLEICREKSDQRARAAGDPAAGPDRGVLVREELQPSGPQADIAQPRVSGGAPAI